MHSPAVTGKTSPLTYTPDLTRKKVEKLIFSRVDMGRWFGTRLILVIMRSNAPLLSVVPAMWLTRIPLYHVRIG